jgi:putative oxidoreductase
MIHGGLAVLRVVVGIVFIAHGWRKFMAGMDVVANAFAGYGIALPLPSAVLVALVELAGGLLLLIGLWTRWAVIPLSGVMLVATLMVHLPKGFFLPEGYEFTLVLLAALVMLGMTGAGALSVDGFRRKRGKEDDQVEAVAGEGPEPS